MMSFFWACLFTAKAESKLQVNGDLKSFFLSSIPIDHIFMPEGAFGQGYLDGRAKLRFDASDNVRFEVHHAITMGTAAPKTQLQLEMEAMGLDMGALGSTMGTSQTGVGLTAPEVVELSWKKFEEEDLFMQGRTDRAFLQASIGTTDFRLGRQAISFGHGMFFNPMDLVQPFSFATIDGEYKPGVDAFRVDQYIGMTGQVTGVVAYAGSWEKEGLIAVLNGNTTIGWTDVSLFYGMIRGDHVFGSGLSTSVGSVGITGDFTYTLPNPDLESDEEPFVRTEMGAMWRPFDDSTVMGEFYYQSLGVTDAADYLSLIELERFTRRELWLMGQTYLSLSWMQQLNSLLSGSIATIINLNDRSYMLTPSLSVSVSDEVSVVAGGYIGIGEEPDAISLTEMMLGKLPVLNSEFGMMGTTGFFQMKAYF